MAMFENLKLRSFAEKAAEDIKDRNLWKIMYRLLRVLFPALWLLRLADSNRAGTDKVYYYSQKTSAAIERSVQVLDDLDLFPKLSILMMTVVLGSRLTTMTNTLVVLEMRQRLMGMIVTTTVMVVTTRVALSVVRL